MTNTDRLISQYEQCRQVGLAFQFTVGKCTGNGPSVVAALRRRGFVVDQLKSGTYAILSTPPKIDNVWSKA